MHHYQKHLIFILYFRLSTSFGVGGGRGRWCGSLAGTAFAGPRWQGSVSLDFVPKGTAVAVHLSHHSMATAVLIDKICVSIPVMQSETYLVEVCDEVEDRYRFGYNTQEKVNEISGVGNHYTAEFWEYGTKWRGGGIWILWIRLVLVIMR